MYWLGIIIIILGLAGIQLYSRTYRKKIAGPAEPIYIIQFRGIDSRPDILANANIAAHIKVIAENGDEYRVYSKLNDSSLKQLIRDEYNLKVSQVVVSSPAGIVFP